MDSNAYSLSDIAAASGGNRDGNGFLWIIVLLFILGAAGGGFGNNGTTAALAANAATQTDVVAGLNNQTVQNQLRDVILQNASDKYETALRVNEQTNLLIQQNNTNLINAIQGFNSVQQAIAGLGAQLNECCCSIKTQMLQDRLDETQAALVVEQNKNNNADQTRELLGQLGRFVAWAGTGTQAGTVATA